MDRHVPAAGRRSPHQKFESIRQFLSLTSYSIKQCCGSGIGRIRTFLVGSGSGRLGPDPEPDPDPGPNK
jgi:hypothetical protein